MILEGLVTTLNADGSVNLAPMGPTVDAGMDRLTFRPFPTSTTYTNLMQTWEGVFHVTDDVELLAKCAVGKLDMLPAMQPATSVKGMILTDACRWYAFRVISIDDREQRVRIETEVVDRGVLREFFGFNRAKHAVLEAAILATRVGILPGEEIRAEMTRLASPVAKTGGAADLAAFEFLRTFIAARLDG